jgi:hypothetical protein
VNSKTEGEIWYFTLGSDALSGRTTFSFGRKKNIQPVGQREREREREREIAEASAVARRGNNDGVDD